MACGNTLDPADMALAAQSTTPLGHPELPPGTDLRNNLGIRCDPIIVKGIVAPEAASALGADLDRTLALNSRAPTWAREEREALTSIAAEVPEIQAQLIKALGNGSIPDEMVSRVPSAMKTIMDTYGRPPGFLSILGPERGTGRGVTGDQTSVLQDLGTRGQKGKGVAYEVLMTARMMQVGLKDLSILGTDKIAFHQKAQGRYGHFGSEKRSCEGDLLIQRNDGRNFAVDFKYRTNSNVSLTSKELEAFATALRAGELHEVCFLSNKGFTKSTLERVSEINRRLDVELRQHQSDFDRSDLTPQERDALEKKCNLFIRLLPHQDWK